MTGAITADKVLAAAIEMEEVGQTFYHALALGCGNQGMAVLCNRLAKDEVNHADLFAKMRKELGRTAPLTDEQTEEFHTMVMEAVIPKPADVSKVALRGGVKEALNMAIRMEQDAIRFYENVLRPVRPDQLSVVEEIIHQERRHLSDLLQQRQAMEM